MGMAADGAMAQRAALLDEMAHWLVPVTPDELALARIVAALPARRIRRLTPAELDRLGSASRDCHANVRRYIERTGDGRTCPGWWRIGEDAFVFHSVVATPRGLVCVSPYNGETSLDFAPDPAIVATPTGFARGGARVPLHLRANPARVIAECTLIRDRLLAGWDPERAVMVPARAASGADRQDRPLPV